MRSAVKLTDRCGEPVVTLSSVTFTQAVGGLTGTPVPRAVKHLPFIQYHAPIVWTTLQLTRSPSMTCSDCESFGPDMT
jgi:hypothetical protein